MKRIIIVLLALLLAAPAMAEVAITATDEGNSDGWVAITYAADAGEGKRPRAFGLNIAVSDGNVVDVDTSTAQPFRIYMGNIDINDVTGLVDNYGSPVAPNTAPDDPCQLGSSPIVVEMGSIYDPCIPSNPNQPAYSGLLIRVQVSEECNITLSANAARADTGVILEDGSSADVNFAAATAVPVSFGCYTGPDKTEWEAVGSPDSWCNPRQCHGESNNQTETIGRGTFWVGFADLTVFLANWQDKAGHVSALQTDYNHASETIGRGTFRCGFADLTKFLANWQDKIGTPADCLTADPCDP